MIHNESIRNANSKGDKMNNTTKANAVRAILSKELTDYEQHAKELVTEISLNEIERHLAIISNQDANEKTLKTLQAVKFLLQSINY